MVPRARRKAVALEHVQMLEGQEGGEAFEHRDRHLLALAGGFALAQRRLQANHRIERREQIRDWDAAGMGGPSQKPVVSMAPPSDCTVMSIAFTPG